MISKRTKNPLAAAKRRGVQLGGDRGGRLSVEGSQGRQRGQRRGGKAAGCGPRVAPMRIRSELNQLA